MLPLGAVAPDFILPDVVTGQPVALAVTGCKGHLVMFICRHCPYVIHIQEELARLGRDYVSQGLELVAISANDAVQYPEDAPDQLKKMALQLKFNFPFCYDESQRVARAYQATCTPDFFLFNAQKGLVYRGQLDDSRPGNQKPVNGADLRAAMDSLLSGHPISTNQKPSMGCGIKWRA